MTACTNYSLVGTTVASLLYMDVALDAPDTRNFPGLEASTANSGIAADRPVEAMAQPNANAVD